MIESNIRGAIVAHNTRSVNCPVLVKFEYDEDNDQLAVRITIPQEDGACVWTFGRQLLSYGSESIEGFGDGDVRIRRGRFDATAVFINLNPGVMPCTLRFEYADVVAFVDATFEAVPAGEEDLDDQIDEAIKELLA